MGIARRSLLVAVAGAALAWPAAASAAPTVVATAVVGTPQDCQAGCIGSLKISCAATDPLSVRTTVRCWLGNETYNAVSSTREGPLAFASSTRYNRILGPFTLCFQGTGRYADGSTASSAVRCTDSDGLAAVVAG